MFQVTRTRTVPEYLELLQITPGDMLKTALELFQTTRIWIGPECPKLLGATQITPEDMLKTALECTEVLQPVATSFCLENAKTYVKMLEPCPADVPRLKTCPKGCEVLQLIPTRIDPKF